MIRGRVKRWFRHFFPRDFSGTFPVFLNLETPPSLFMFWCLHLNSVNNLLRVNENQNLLAFHAILFGFFFLVLSSSFLPFTTIIHGSWVCNPVSALCAAFLQRLVALHRRNVLFLNLLIAFWKSKHFYSRRKPVLRKTSGKTPWRSVQHSPWKPHLRFF